MMSQSRGLWHSHSQSEESTHTEAKLPQVQEKEEPGQNKNKIKAVISTTLQGLGQPHLILIKAMKPASKIDLLPKPA